MAANATDKNFTILCLVISLQPLPSYVKNTYIARTPVTEEEFSYLLP